MEVGETAGPRSFSGTGRSLVLPMREKREPERRAQTDRICPGTAAPRVVGRRELSKKPRIVESLANTVLTRSAATKASPHRSRVRKDPGPYGRRPARNPRFSLRSHLLLKNSSHTSLSRTLGDGECPSCDISNRHRAARPLPASDEIARGDASVAGRSDVLRTREVVWTTVGRGQFVVGSLIDVSGNGATFQKDSADPAEAGHAGETK